MKTNLKILLLIVGLLFLTIKVALAESLEELTNEDLKRIVNKYFHADNMYSFTIIGNSHFKKWYHGTIMFIATNFIFPFWNPFIDY